MLFELLYQAHGKWVLHRLSYIDRVVEADLSNFMVKIVDTVHNLAAAFDLIPIYDAASLAKLR